MVGVPLRTTSDQVSGTVESSLLVTSVPVSVPGVPVPQSSGRHFSTYPSSKQ